MRVYREFVKTYIDNIIVFNHILKKHLIYLYIIFRVINFYDINFSSKKSFLNYFIVTFLNQKMNAFELIIAIKRLNAIIKLNFLYIFKNLKIYFDLID